MSDSRPNSRSEILIARRADASSPGRAAPVPKRKKSSARSSKSSKTTTGTNSRAGKTRTKNQPRSTLAKLAGTRGIKLLLVFAGVLAAGSAFGAGAKALFAWARTSDTFAIRELVVRTGPRVSERDVLMLANLKEGDNILDFSLVDCVNAIEIHPWVKRASVMRQLPDRVVIEVEEREPRAMIATPSLYYVDSDAEVFKRVGAGDNVDYPLITGFTLRDVIENKDGVESSIRLALELLGLSRESKVMPPEAVSEIRLGRSEGVVLVRSADGMRIDFGREGFPEKWERMERTIVELKADAAKVAVLDLNYAGRVTVRFHEGYRVMTGTEQAAN